MIILGENEVCKLKDDCPYNVDDSCFGARSGRDSVFSCDYVKDGQIEEGKPTRLFGDKTGRMKVIME